MDKGIEFLYKVYNNLHMKSEVLNKNPNSRPQERIQLYIDRLEDTHGRFRNDERAYSRLKTLYYNKYIIKEEDIPESYFDFQDELALNRGYGHNAIDRIGTISTIINDQKETLEKWIDYFVCKDSDVYPMWLKYWAFQGMLTLGTYNKGTEKFSKRSKGTIAPFIDLNREALAKSLDLIIQLNEGKLELEDKDLENLVEAGSFSKIYPHVLTQLMRKSININRENTKGVWVMYKKGQDHMPLVRSLEGYNTGWCTAGEGTAKKQLEGGNFYVYYSYDEQNEPVIPRIAIRMEGKSIAEVRGIAANQEMELEMLDIAETKLDTFPDKEDYKKKVTDMKKLTEIYNKSKNEEIFTVEELAFLYESKQAIASFGYKKDPRISEIIKLRDITQDLEKILNHTQSQSPLALTLKKILELDGKRKNNIELTEEELVFLYNMKGDMQLSSYHDWQKQLVQQIINNRNIGKDLINILAIEPSIIEDEKNRQNFTISASIYNKKRKNEPLNAEEIEFIYNINTRGMTLGKEIYRDIILSIIQEAKNGRDKAQDLTILAFTNPEVLTDKRLLSSFQRLATIYNKQNDNEDLTLEELKTLYESDETLTGISAVADRILLKPVIENAIKQRNIKEDLSKIYDCDVEQIATNYEQLRIDNIVCYYGNLIIKEERLPDDIHIPSCIHGTVSARNLKNSKGFERLIKITGSADFSSLETTEGLSSLVTVLGSVFFNELKNAEGLKQLTNVGSIHCESLKKATGLESLTTIRGYANFDELRSPKGLSSLTNITKNAYFPRTVLPPSVYIEGSAEFSKSKRFVSNMMSGSNNKFKKSSR